MPHFLFLLSLVKRALMFCCIHAVNAAVVCPGGLLLLADVGTLSIVRCVTADCF